MLQSKFTIENEHDQFLRKHEAYGFNDRSAMVRAALDRFINELEQRQMAESAVLYAELYEEDIELQQLADAAIEDWPE